MNYTWDNGRTGFPRRFAFGGIWLGLGAVVWMAGPTRILPPATAQSAASSAEKQDQAMATYRTAMDDLILNGDRAKARTEFAAAIAQNPACLPAHYNLGLLYGLDAQWDAALAEFNAIKQTDATSFYAKRSDDIIANIHRIQESDKTPEGKSKRQWEDSLMTARILTEQGQYKAALAELTTAAQIDASKPEAYVMGARILVRQQLYDDAISLLQAALSHAADTDKADLNALIDAVTKEQAHQAALKEKYISLTKAGGQALADKKYDVAADKLSQAAALFPLRLEAQFRAASAEALNGNIGKALERLGKLRHLEVQGVADRAAKMQRSLWVADALDNPPDGGAGASLADTLTQICTLANAHALNTVIGDPDKDVAATKNEDVLSLSSPTGLTRSMKTSNYLKGVASIHDQRETAELADLDPDAGTVEAWEGQKPGFMVRFPSNSIGSKSDLLKSETIDTDGDKKDVKNDTASAFVFIVSDQATANQLKELIIHAIKLGRAVNPWIKAVF